MVASTGKFVESGCWFCYDAAVEDSMKCWKGPQHARPQQCGKDAVAKIDPGAYTHACVHTMQYCRAHLDAVIRNSLCILIHMCHVADCKCTTRQAQQRKNIPKRKAELNAAKKKVGQK